MKNSIIRDARITPEQVAAGDTVEFTISFTADKDFSATGSRIVFDLPAYMGQDRPSRYDQETGGYVEVFCDNADIEYRCLPWDMEIMDFPTRTKSSFKGTAQRLLVIDFLSGPVREGDRITVKWGWLRHGFAIGCRVTPLVLKPEFINTVHLRYFRDGSRSLPDLGRSFKGYDRPEPDLELPLTFRVVPRQAERLRLVRGVTETAVLAYDRYFNLCPELPSETRFESNADFQANSYGVPVTSRQNVEIRPQSLPLKTTPPMNDVFQGMNIYFGDLHTHSSHSIDCIEREKQEMTPADNFHFGRDAARLDFMAVTDHHQPWDDERHKLGESAWNALLEAVRNYDEAGRFLAFPGIEYRCGRGDTAVIFNESVDYALIDDPRMSDIREFWKLMRGHNYITIPHYHNPGRLPDDQWFSCPDPGIETIQEIYSCHGAYDVEHSLERLPPQIKERRYDRNGNWMLKQGLKYGLCANSDGHKGKPGINGLTAVYARELTRDAILTAIRQRHVYATTNARIRLLFAAGEHLMGSELACRPESIFRIEAAGEETLKAVELLKNGELYRRFRPMSETFAEEMRVDTATPSYWYVRAVQTDNEIAWSSPIWFE